MRCNVAPHLPLFDIGCFRWGHARARPIRRGLLCRLSGQGVNRRDRGGSTSVSFSIAQGCAFDSGLPALPYGLLSPPRCFLLSRTANTDNNSHRSAYAACITFATHYRQIFEGVALLLEDITAVISTMLIRSMLPDCGRVFDD